MRKLFTILAAVLLTVSVFAQSPEKMSYQAVIRDASDNLVTSQTVGMQITILQGSASGAAVYAETQTPTTNANGLVSLEIGTGTTSDDFSAIDWANGPYFIKTETDPAGGTNYTITGTSQLLSIPYALHAKTAETVTGGITETDPVYGSSVASGITGTDTTNWNNKLDSEIDPVYGSSIASGITSTDTTNWNNKLDSESDPVYGSSVASGITGTDTTSWNNKLDSESDPVYGSSVASGITSTDTTNWNNKLDSEIDPSVPLGTQTGEMQYWNGSEWITVAAGNEGQILTVYNGIPTWTYNISIPNATNPITGDIWMDRNLGAVQVATSLDDAASFGDLYQWGRCSDGHQLRTSGWTNTLSGTDVPGHGDFIVPPGDPLDWRSPANTNLWQGVNGINNPCPAGYRLPTEAEMTAERASWVTDNIFGAFDSPLKLPAGGMRYSFDNTVPQDAGEYGGYWTSTVDGTKSKELIITDTFVMMQSNHRSKGFSVRCIKD